MSATPGEMAFGAIAAHLGGGSDHDERVGALVTLDLPDDSPILGLPWIITFGPLGDADEWEPVVCGPYERPHALALAEAVVADEQLLAVVEPVLPALSAEEIRSEIAAAQIAAEDEAAQIDAADRLQRVAARYAEETLRLGVPPERALDLVRAALDAAHPG